MCKYKEEKNIKLHKLLSNFLENQEEGKENLEREEIIDSIFGFEYKASSISNITKKVM